jgi:hypothetical protein
MWNASLISWSLTRRQVGAGTGLFFLGGGVLLLKGWGAKAAKDGGAKAGKGGVVVCLCGWVGGWVGVFEASCVVSVGSA